MVLEKASQAFAFTTNTLPYYAKKSNFLSGILPLLDDKKTLPNVDFQIPLSVELLIFSVFSPLDGSLASS